MAGDENEKRYRSAVKSYEDQDGSCRKVSGASARISEQLAKCAEREKAEEPVLAAGEEGVEDWIEHLGEMRASAQGKIHKPPRRASTLTTRLSKTFYPSISEAVLQRSYG